MNKRLTQNAAYFQSFTDYLQNGDLQTLSSVFPDAEDLSAAAIYRNGYLRNCVDALRSNFPTVYTLIGEDYFTRLALRYIDCFPPQKSTLVGYGETFPDHIKQNVSEHKLAYLSSFARLDLAWLSAYFAASSEVLTADTVQRWLNTGSDIPSLRVTLVGSALLQTLEFEISALWSTLKDHDNFEQTVHAPQSPETVLVWRDSNDHINVKSLNDAEYTFITPFVNQASTVGVAATAAMKFDPKFDVSEFFSVLLVNDLLTSPSI